MSAGGRVRFWVTWSLCLLALVGVALLASGSEGFRSFSESVSADPGGTSSSVRDGIMSVLNYPGEAFASLVRAFDGAVAGLGEYGQIAGSMAGAFESVKGVGGGLASGVGGIGKSIGGLGGR